MVLSYSQQSTILDSSKWISLELNEQWEMTTCLGGGESEILDYCLKNGVTDLLVLAHGINNPKSDAEKIYNDFVQTVNKYLESHSDIFSTPKTFLIVQIFWPSVIRSDWKYYVTDFIKKIEEFDNYGYISFSKLLNTLHEVCINIRKQKPFYIHLIGHSTGTYFLWNSLLKSNTSIQTLLLIQSFIGQESLKGNWVSLRNNVVGSTLITISSKDDSLTWYDRVKLFLNKSIGLYGAINAYEKTLPLAKNDSFHPQRLYNLHASDVITNHDDFKKESIAEALLKAISITNPPPPLNNLQLLSKEEVKSSPFVYKGHGYFQGKDDKLCKLNIDNGNCEHLYGHYTKSTPFVFEDYVYYQGTNNKLYKVSIDGKDPGELWGFEAKSSPFIYKGYVYFQGTDDMLWKVSIAHAHEKPEHLHRHYTKSTPFVSEDYVYFQGTDDKLWKVSIDGKTTNHKLWENEANSSPFIYQGHVYFQGTDDKKGEHNKLYKLNIDNGKCEALGGNLTQSTPFVFEGYVYFQGQNNKLYKVNIDGTNTNPLWDLETKPFVQQYPLLVSNGYLYYLEKDSTLWRFPV